MDNRRSGHREEWTMGQQEQWIVDNVKYGQQELELQGYKEDKEKTARRKKAKNNITLVKRTCRVHLCKWSSFYATSKSVCVSQKVLFFGIIENGCCV